MQRRGRSGQPVKGRRTTRPKARKAPIGHASLASLRDKLDQVTRELGEAGQRETATSEVLKVISSSAGELGPVFDAMLANATRICEAKIGVLYLGDEDNLRAVAATYDAPPAYVEARKQSGKNFPLDGPIRRAASTKQVAHVTDIRELQSYLERHPMTVVSVELGKFRTVLAVPMLKDDELIGVITLNRQEVRPFTDKQIELVKNFAAQAVIAIENTRLLNELRQRTDDLTESAGAADGDFRGAESHYSSPGELEPVFKRCLRTRRAFAKRGLATSSCMKMNDAFRMAAMHGAPPEFAEKRGREPIIHPSPKSPLFRLAKTRQLLHIIDLRIDEAYVDGDLPTRAFVELAGTRTIVVVPMLKDDKLIGAIGIYRQEVRPFTDKQIELLKNFAAQAVIAIENTRLLNELRQRTDDLSESLEQQTATSEVLKVISSSPGELEPVFNAMLGNAVRICGAKFGNLWLREGDAFRISAMYGAPPAYADYLHGNPIFHPFPGTALGRIFSTKQAVQIPDARLEDAYAEGSPLHVGTIALARARTIIAVPLLKDGELIGAMVIFRQEVRPFTEKQVELVRNFAAQAVIAIENTRLLNELRQRTGDLSEALEQQTATSEVLRVISSSPSELTPVFQTMLANATRLCEANFGTLNLHDNDDFPLAATHNVPEVYAEYRHHHPIIKADQRHPLARVAASKQVLQIADMRAEPLYLEKDPSFIAMVDLAGARTLFIVPMLKENELVGVITIFRQEVRPFTDKQIELVQNFAAQAVIAIENTRLLNELRQRTDDLSEALEQQTATSEVLKVISSSPGELKPVFEAMLANATRICEATFGNLFLREGPILRAVAVHGKKIYADSWQRDPVIDLRDNRGVPLDKLANTKQVTHVPDLQTEPSYINKNVRMTNLVDVAGARTYLAVPMLKDGELVGAIGLYREEVRPFTDKQIELVQNFAAQAVIAIESTRLLSELRESLQQQTATADVLKVISRSTFDLQTVLQTLVKLAARLCDADKGNITREKDGVFYRAAASYGYSRQFVDHIKGIPLEPDRGSATGRALLEGQVVHIHDVKADTEYALVEAQKLGDYRTILCVPMLREGVALGVLTLTRSEVRPFTDKQIELVATFADQAAIAIENVRLFESVEARTRELAASLENLRTTQDRLVQTQKLASLGQLTAGIAHEIKNPLNFVNNFSGVSAELIDELQEALKDVNLNEKRRKEINELTNMLRGNLDKVVQHGKRADAIVKNMLLHSREGSGEHRVVDINALVEESLNLAYHGARAEKQGFNIALERSLDPTTGEADVFPQDITRALLNLILNGFYAATKRKAEANGGDYDPTLIAATKNLGDRVEIRIRDNGTGIPPEVKEKIFNPFFTTKPAGEGTGLGLSISHDIIVKQHGGSIEVETQPGQFTEFKIILPRTAATIAKSGERS